MCHCGVGKPPHEAAQGQVRQVRKRPRDVSETESPLASLQRKPTVTGALRSPCSKPNQDLVAYVRDNRGGKTGIAVGEVRNTPVGARDGG